MHYLISSLLFARHLCLTLCRSVKCLKRESKSLKRKDFTDLRDGIITEVDIQEEYNTEIIELITKISYNLSDKETTRKAVSNLRINTGTLRRLVLARDGGKYRLCDINDEKLLVCSHIKPWRTGEARLDINRDMKSYLEYHRKNVFMH
jgi:hypothetical protein